MDTIALLGKVTSAVDSPTQKTQHFLAVLDEAEEGTTSRTDKNARACIPQLLACLLLLTSYLAIVSTGSKYVQALHSRVLRLSTTHADGRNELI